MVPKTWNGPRRPSATMLRRGEQRGGALPPPPPCARAPGAHVVGGGARHTVVPPRHERVEHVLAAGEAQERLLYAGPRAAVLELVPVLGADDHRGGALAR